MSSVEIIIDGTDYTDACLFSRCSFQQSMAAVPGTFQVTVRDPERSLEFVTGVEISLEVDGVRMFGGYVTQVSMGHLAPAADTSDLDDYNLRIWNLRGVDYNIIFDKRVVRNTSDYLSYIEINEASDGAILRTLVDTYADMNDFDSSGIEDIASIDGDVIQQGIKIRERFENLSYFGGAIWYVDGNKNIIYTPYENVEKRWGFSDVPNHNGITASPDEFQGATTGFREVEATEDSTSIVNDALIWGGSEFAGSGGTVFSREENSTSQSIYGRWQYAETHFNETNYKTQFGVDARADVIVKGPPGTDIYGEQKGLRYPQWQFDFTWFSVDVPELSGTPDHLVAGDIVTIDMDVFGVTKLLPLRSLSISFPDALATSGDPDDRVVQFQGSFGLQMGDPFTLWRYLQKAERRAASTITSSVVPPVTDTSPVASYGAFYRGIPTPATDGTTDDFSIPFTYIAGSTQVYLNGLLQRPGVEYTESNPSDGVFTMTTAPGSTDYLLVVATTTTGSSTIITPPPVEPPSGDIFYMSPTGSDTTGNGTNSNPWRSIQKFIDTDPAPGTTLYLRGGNYSQSQGGFTGQDTYGSLIGTSSDPITISNYPSEIPVFPNMPGRTIAFSPNETSNTIGASYVVLNGIRFPGCSPDDEAVVVIGGHEPSLRLVNNITISNCFFGLAAGTASIDHCLGIIHNAEDIIIEDCEFQGPGTGGGGGNGIAYYSQPATINVLVQRCIFHDWQWTAMQVWDYQTSSPDATFEVKHCTFKNNVVDLDLRYHSTALVQDCVFDTAYGSTTGSAIYDPFHSASTTLSFNYFSQTLTSSYGLTAGSPAINGASDSSDAGAVPYP